MKYFLLSFLCTYQLVTGTEFAFDLPRNDVQCFFEEINENILCNFEYQVSYLEGENQRDLVKMFIGRF